MGTTGAAAERYRAKCMSCARTINYREDVVVRGVSLGPVGRCVPCVEFMLDRANGVAARPPEGFSGDWRMFSARPCESMRERFERASSGASESDPDDDPAVAQREREAASQRARGSATDVPAEGADFE
jgi:hypothetical protein